MEPEAEATMKRHPPGEQAAGRMRKRQHAAFLLPVAGLLLIIPPLLTVFGLRRLVFGAPLQTVYLFLVWLAMIAGAALLARLLPATDTDDDPVAGES